jgi:hypothetical protein
MMYEGEKSDPAVRARKSANKAEEAAEPMEQRAGAKGKAIASTTTGLRVGQACHRGSIVYGNEQGKIETKSLPRCFITSLSICSPKRITG